VDLQPKEPLFHLFSAFKVNQCCNRSFTFFDAFHGSLQIVFLVCLSFSKGEVLGVADESELSAKFSQNSGILHASHLTL
jgi:hypothetical protein